MWELYTYWHYEAVVRALNGIVMVMGGDGYTGLLKSMALVGLIVSTAVGLAKVSAAEPGKFFVFLLLGYSVMFVPKVTVSVRDIGSGQGQNVANVPLGIAFFATSTSQIGKYLTDTFDTAFAPVDSNLSFSRSGLGWGASAMATMAQVKPRDQTLAPAMANFVRSCVVPEIVDNPMAYDVLSRSPNIFTALAADGFLNPGRVVYMPIGDAGAGQYLPCTSGDQYNALTRLRIKIDAEAEAQKVPLARLLMKYIPPTSQGTDSQILALADSQLGAASSALLGASGSVKDHLFQAITANLMNESGAELATARGDWGAVQLAAGAAIANAQSISSYQVLGMIGSEALPRIRNIVEVVLLATFPIIVIMMIVGGERGGTVVSSYAITCLWIQLWAPLYSIVNNLLQPLTISRFKSILSSASSGGGGGSSQIYGLSMQNMDTIIATGYSEQAMAGALVMAVPAIAYALVKGGAVAVSGAISPLSAPASGAASSAGAQAGLGNFNLGNTSWGAHSSNTTTGNKFDSAGAITQGRFQTTQGLMSRTYGSGGEAVDAGQMVSNLGAISAQVGASAKQAISTAASTEHSKGTTATQQYMSGISTAVDNFRRQGTSSGISDGVTTKGGVSTASATQQSASSGLSKIESEAKRLGISTEQMAGLTFAAGASAGWNFKDSLLGKALGAELGARTSLEHKQGTSQSRSGAIEAAQRLSKDEDVKSLQSVMRQNQVSTEGSNTRTSQSSVDAGKSANLTTTMGHLEQAQQQFAKAEKLQEMAASANDSSSSVNQDLSNRVLERLRENGHDTDRVLRAANLGSGQERADAQAAIMAASRSVAEEMVQSQLGAWSLTRPGAPPSGSGTDGAAVQAAVADMTSAAVVQVQEGKAATANSGADALNAQPRPVSNSAAAQAVMTAAGGGIGANQAVLDSKSSDLQGAYKAAQEAGQETRDKSPSSVRALVDGPDMGGLSPKPETPTNADASQHPAA
jgi:conjugal transfer mating pair stabilization protein TraG